jgi:hypothetical protein
VNRLAKPPIAAGAIPGIAGAVLSERLLLSPVDGAKPVNAVAYVAAVLGMALMQRWAFGWRLAPLSGSMS